jgi:small redox-active disulfide protein 2
MKIKVLGTGCPNCKRLLNNAQSAVQKSGYDIEVIYVNNIREIMKTGVVQLPALLINNEVKSIGRILSVDEIIKIIQENMG